MSALEMKIFVLNDGLIFGDLIPEGNRYWRLYILLRKILDIILKKKVNNNIITDLENLVHEHNTLFIALFSKFLKPKFHFMTH